MRKVTKGNVTIKLWDLGGQPRFRSMWERYCRAVSAIVYGTNFLYFFELFYLPMCLHPCMHVSLRSIIYMPILIQTTDKCLMYNFRAVLVMNLGVCTVYMLSTCF